MTTKLFRSKVLLSLSLLFVSGLIAAGPEMVVYKTKTCGCCSKWVEHLRAKGFTVTVKEVDSMVETHRKLGVPANLQSCHTGAVNGYSIEGHVPAADITRLLKEHPKARGLAVPGMPAGSPGMEVDRKDAYSVMMFQASGEATVYKSYPGDGK